MKALSQQRELEPQTAVCGFRQYGSVLSACLGNADRLGLGLGLDRLIPEHPWSGFSSTHLWVHETAFGAAGVFLILSTQSKWCFCRPGRVAGLGCPLCLSLWCLWALAFGLGLHTTAALEIDLSRAASLLQRRKQQQWERQSFVGVREQR